MSGLQLGTVKAVRPNIASGQSSSVLFSGPPVGGLQGKHLGVFVQHTHLQRQIEIRLFGYLHRYFCELLSRLKSAGCKASFLVKR